MPTATPSGPYDTKHGLHPTVNAMFESLAQAYYNRYGKPLEISSGFRSRAQNEALKNSARNSRHLYGLAVDIKGASNMSGEERAWLIRMAKELGFKGVGDYHSGSLHFDLRESDAFWRSHTR
jgi:uncharacterized protein YcbK (DUF882 family)